MVLNKKLKSFIKNSLPDSLLLHRKNSNCNCISLTFDDGPYPENTEKILKILRESNIKATFFMNGKAIQQHRETFLKVVNDGHEIGNHFYNHKPVTALTYGELKKEVEGFWKLLKEITLKNSFPKLIRPPYGKLNLKTLWYAWKNDLTVVLWSIDTGDLEAESLQDNIETIEAIKIMKGDIILLHEDSNHADGLLEYIVQRAKSENLYFVTISELLKDNL